MGSDSRLENHPQSDETNGESSSQDGAGNPATDGRRREREEEENANRRGRGVVVRPSGVPETRPTISIEIPPSTTSPTKETMKNTPTTPRRAVRASEEFDRRYDGPFGRPSLAMARRSSSQVRGRSIDSPVVSEELADLEQAVSEPGAGPEAGMVVATRKEGFLPEPPRLNYSLRSRRWSILLFWTVILIDSVAMPIALYFGLWYGVGPGTNTATEIRETLSANAVFSIVTAAIGGASIVEYFVRFWRLFKKNSQCRVMGAHRWYLDWFHWNFSLAWIIIMIELIVGTVPRRPPIRLLSMPLTTMLYAFGTELLVVDLLRYFRVPAPVRLSSIPRGAQLRPGIYTLIEDICAVDGSGGTAFREALDRRYEASHIFRAMLRRLGIFWAVGAEGMAVVCTVLVFTIDDDAAYVVGWSAPFVWAGVWTVFTFWYVKRELQVEDREWSEEVAMGESPKRTRHNAFWAS